MTFWIWMFLIFFGLIMVPTSWLVGQAVGMERTSWWRAVLFAVGQSLVALLAMELVPLSYFILNAIVGLFAALFVSPLFFRLLMTGESARALLGSILLTVVSVGGAVLFLIF
jgi:hypothetical protein